MDMNKVGKMIDSVLKNTELVKEIEEMALRNESPEDAVALFLIGEIDPYGLNFIDYHEYEDQDTIPCTKKEWEEVMESCRKATEGAEHYTLLEENPRLVEKWAWVGQWPDSIPWEYREGGRLSDLAWAWAWARDEKTFKKFLEGNPPLLEMSHRDGSWKVASGLLLAVRRSMVKIPDENLEKFLISYSSWYRGPGNADVSSMVFAMELEPSSMSESVLQNLAGCWDRAAYELGRRRITLRLSYLQKKTDWKCGVYSTIPLYGLEQDAERYLISESRVERYCLSHEYSYGYRYETMPVDSSDPFGPRMNKFLFLTGMEEFPSCPSFEEVEEYVLKKSGDRNKK